MHREDDCVRFRLAANQECAKQWATVETKWLRRRFSPEPLHFVLLRRFIECAEIDQRKRKTGCLVNDLDGLLVGHRKRGPEGFMAADEFTNTPFERTNVEHAVKTRRRINVVSRVVWFESIDEPETLLREREWQR